MEHLNVTSHVPPVTAELKHLLNNEEECNAFIKAENKAELQRSQGVKVEPLSSQEYLNVIKIIHVQISSVLKPQKGIARLLSVLSEHALALFFLVIALVVAVNNLLPASLDIHKTSVFIVEFVVLTVISLAMGRWKRGMWNAVESQSRSLSRYNLTYVWLAFALMFTVNSLNIEYVKAYSFEVIMCEAAVLWGLACVLGDWEDRARQRAMAEINTAMPDDIISDADLKLLSSNPFIKVWMRILIERNESLTYSILDNSRSSITDLVNIFLNSGEQKRMREIITVH